MQGMSHKVETIHRQQQERLAATEEELFRAWNAHKEALRKAINSLRRRKRLATLRSAFLGLK